MFVGAPEWERRRRMKRAKGGDGFVRSTMRLRSLATLTDELVGGVEAVVSAGLTVEAFAVLAIRLKLRSCRGNVRFLDQPFLGMSMACTRLGEIDQRKAAFVSCTMPSQ